MAQAALKVVGKEDNSDRKRALEAALSQIDRAFGKGSVMKLGSRDLGLATDAVSTGSLGLDIALGIGGLPRGRVIEIYGPESSGKTTLALQVVAPDQVGGFGWTGQATADLGSSAAQRWHYGPALTWSFLDIGRVHQRVRASEARAAGAAAAYQDTVLRALEETENAMAGYRAANEAAITLGSAVTASRSATDLANARLGAGAVDTLVVLDAERSQLDLEDQLATAQSQRATSLAALYKALAGDFGAMP